MLSSNASDSIILLTDFLLLISFWGRLGASGMILVGLISVFTRSMEDDCLVLGVAKNKSLTGRLEYSNYSILKSTILSLTRYGSLFLFKLFMNFPWIISSLTPSRRCSLFVFSESTVLFIINLVQTESSMLLKIINVSVWELCNFISYGDVGVIVRLSKWKWPNTPRNRIITKTVIKTINSTKNL